MMGLGMAVASAGPHANNMSIIIIIIIVIKMKCQLYVGGAAERRWVVGRQRVQVDRACTGRQSVQVGCESHLYAGGAVEWR